jgi:hypothetical protein
MRTTNKTSTRQQRLYSTALLVVISDLKSENQIFFKREMGVYPIDL